MITNALCRNLLFLSLYCSYKHKDRHMRRQFSNLFSSYLLLILNMHFMHPAVITTWRWFRAKWDSRGKVYENIISIQLLLIFFQRDKLIWDKLHVWKLISWYFSYLIGQSYSQQNLDFSLQESIVLAGFCFLLGNTKYYQWYLMYFSPCRGHNAMGCKLCFS